MNKTLVNTFEDFFNLMHKAGYWDNSYSLEKAKRDCENRIESYPCLIVHDWGEDYYRRSIGNWEPVYLSDFNLDRCENCGRLGNYDNIIYGYAGHGVWGNICEDCKDIEDLK